MPGDGMTPVLVRVPEDQNPTCNLLNTRILNYLVFCPEEARKRIHNYFRAKK
jgi:hypothetical protein